nr:hypothetical protein [Hyphomonas sp.]
MQPRYCQHVGEPGCAQRIGIFRPHETAISGHQRRCEAARPRTCGVVDIKRQVAPQGT